LNIEWRFFHINKAKLLFRGHRAGVSSQRWCRATFRRPVSPEQAHCLPGALLPSHGI